MASSSSRCETSFASSRSQPSSCGLVSSGPRGLPRCPVNALHEPTCLASARSSTIASSIPEAILHAALAISSACAHSPRRRRVAAAAPALRSSPELAKPRSPSSGRPFRSSSPSLPPKPRSRSIGNGSSRVETAAGGSRVCWLGLWSPPQSFESSLFEATPAEHVKPSRRSTSLRARETSTAPAASRSSALGQLRGQRDHQVTEASSTLRTTCPACPARNELRARIPVGCAPSPASTAASAAPATCVFATKASSSKCMTLGVASSSAAAWRGGKGGVANAHNDA